MKDIRVTLPIVKHAGMPVRIRLGLDHFAWETTRGMIYYTFNKWLLASTILLSMALVYFIKYKPNEITRVYNLVHKNGVYSDANGEVYDVDFPHDSFSDLENVKKETLRTDIDIEDLCSQFLDEKHKLIYRYKTNFKVNRTEQLPIDALLNLNKDISALFSQKILPLYKDEKDKAAFFNDNESIFKIETALMEQAKYHIPASIKLAQAAYATNFGNEVHHNNYFNLREKENKDNERVVTEYLTKDQILKYKKFIISHEPVQLGNPNLFACKIKQSFKAYYSPWASFRDHSLYLTKTRRFTPLFTKGNNYKKWTGKLGNPVLGGLGYSTEPDYGKSIEQIIENYHLHLLDH